MKAHALQWPWTTTAGLCFAVSAADVDALMTICHGHGRAGLLVATEDVPAVRVCTQRGHGHALCVLSQYGRLHQDASIQSACTLFERAAPQSGLMQQAVSPEVDDWHAFYFSYPREHRLPILPCDVFWAAAPCPYSQDRLPGGTWQQTASDVVVDASSCTLTATFPSSSSGPSKSSINMLTCPTGRFYFLAIFKQLSCSKRGHARFAGSITMLVFACPRHLAPEEPEMMQMGVCGNMATASAG